MRYYVYLDRELIKHLMATFNTQDFNIDFIEYSVQKNCGNVNNFRVEPRFEKFSDEKEGNKRKGNSIGFDSGTTYNIITEKKYINISDVSDMKNINFYHNLIEKLRVLEKEDRCEHRIIEQSGKITLLRNNLSSDCNMAQINGNYIWYNNKFCNEDMSVLSNMANNVKVIGYNINENRGVKAIKAIAMYIE